MVNTHLIQVEWDDRFYRVRWNKSKIFIFKWTRTL